MDLHDVVPRSVFSVDELPEADRYAHWKESISCIFTVDAERGVRSERFNAKVDAHLIDTLMVAETSTRPQTWHRSAANVAADGMDHIMIQLFKSGSMAYEAGGLEHKMPDGGLVVFDLAREAKTVTGDFTNLSLFVPREMIEPYLRDSGDLHLRYFSAKEPLVQMLHSHMSILNRIRPQMSVQQARDVVEPTIGLAAACLNGTMDGSPEDRSGVPIAQIAAAKKAIEAQLGDPQLSPETIARGIGVSRSRLYQILEPYGGVASYIRERRLRRVANRLIDPMLSHRPVYAIALENGFENISSFSRMFKQRFGESARDFRKGYVGRRRSAENGGLAAAGYDTWLHQL